MVNYPDWHNRAECAKHDPDIFFPNGYLNHKADAALAVCHACPVRKLCLADALVEWQEYGVFGGTTPAQRRKIAAMNGSNSKRTKRPPPSPGTPGHTMRHRRAKEPLCEACKTYESVKNAAYKERRRELRAQAKVAS